MHRIAEITINRSRRMRPPEKPYTVRAVPMRTANRQGPRMSPNALETPKPDSAKLDEGAEIPEVTVFEEDGEFFVESGAEAALARSFGDEVFFRARLVKGSSEGKKYVKMKNSL